MKTSRYREEQIAYALKQTQPRTSVAEVCRQMGISEATLFRWKQNLSGLGPSALRRPRQLAEENAKLKRLVRDLSMDKAMLQEVLEKGLTLCRQRGLVRLVQQAFGVSKRRGCSALRFHRSYQRYRSRRDDQAPLRSQ